jgi:diguanylate cyclase (GGDEF)-like protein
VQAHDHGTVQAGQLAAAVAEQKRAEADALSGVLRSQAGFAALQRELDRAYRTCSALTVVIVVDEGGAVQDQEQEQRADDTLLHGVASALLSNVRSYDLVIRISGDAFVCALCGGTVTDARTRFCAVQQALARSGTTIAIGYADIVAANDTPTSLIDCAYADLICTRAGTPRRRPRKTASEASRGSKGRRAPRP